MLYAPVYGGILEVNAGGTSFVGLQCADLQWLTTANFAALIPILSESQQLEPLSTTGSIHSTVRQTLPRAVTALEI